MTFKIKADPTFEASLTLVGQGREQTLKVTFNHMLRSEYLGLLDQIREGKADTADALLKVIHGWDADSPPTKETFALLQDQQPGADWAILTGYGDALAVARKGN